MCIVIQCVWIISWPAAVPLFPAPNCLVAEGLNLRTLHENRTQPLNQFFTRKPIYFFLIYLVNIWQCIILRSHWGRPCHSITRYRYFHSRDGLWSSSAFKGKGTIDVRRIPHEKQKHPNSNKIFRLFWIGSKGRNIPMQGKCHGTNQGYISTASLFQGRVKNS